MGTRYASLGSGCVLRNTGFLRRDALAPLSSVGTRNHGHRDSDLHDAQKSPDAQTFTLWSIQHIVRRAMSAHTAGGLFLSA
jgi:hypothetical protein